MTQSKDDEQRAVIGSDLLVDDPVLHDLERTRRPQEHEVDLALRCVRRKGEPGPVLVQDAPRLAQEAHHGVAPDGVALCLDSVGV